MTYCHVKNGAIAAYLNEGSPFGVSDAGDVYPGFLPDGIDGVNYPQDWLAKAGAAWARSVGLLRLVVTGDSSGSPFYLVEYADAVVAGVPTRTYSRKAKPLDECRKFVAEQVLALRWSKRTGGFVWNGQTIRTDDVSLNSMTGAVALFDKDPTLTAVEWDVGGGNFVTLDRVAMQGLAVAAGRYVQAVYSASKVILSAVGRLATVADCAAFDVNAGWP